MSQVLISDEWSQCNKSLECVGISPSAKHIRFLSSTFLAISLPFLEILHTKCHHWNVCKLKFKFYRINQNWSRCWTIDVGNNTSKRLIGIVVYNRNHHQPNARILPHRFRCSGCSNHTVAFETFSSVALGALPWKQVKNRKPTALQIFAQNIRKKENTRFKFEKKKIQNI